MLKYNRFFPGGWDRGIGSKRSQVVSAFKCVRVGRREEKAWVIEMRRSVRSCVEGGVEVFEVFECRGHRGDWSLASGILFEWSPRSSSDEGL
jgi:hypothetical protein